MSDDPAPGHPLNPDATWTEVWPYPYQRNAYRRTPPGPSPDPRERALCLLVPLRLIGEIDALTDAQRAAVWAIYSEGHR